MLAARPLLRRSLADSAGAAAAAPPRPIPPARLLDVVQEYALRKPTRVTLQQLVRLHRAGSKPAFFNTATYIKTELPIRLAKRVAAMQSLPFIVGVNPWIRTVYELYLDSFKKIVEFPDVVDPESEARFREMLLDLTEAHGEVIPSLAKGFLEAKKYMPAAETQRFLDGMISARIGIRVLAEHYLSLKDTDREDYIGILNTKLSPAKMVHAACGYVKELCEINYGSSPDYEVNGDTQTLFAYVPVHLEYVLMETLKNAFRATVEFSEKKGRLVHPSLEVTVCSSKEDVMIRIRDCGGGIPYEDIDKIFKYSYTTVPKYDENDGGIFFTQARLQMQAGVGGPMAGLGFGVPMTNVYAKYFGGEFTLKPLHEHGMDAFLRLPNIMYLDSEVSI